MQSVLHDSLFLKTRTKARLRLIGDSHDEVLVAALKRAGYDIDFCPSSLKVPALYAFLENADVVLFDVTAQPRTSATILKELTSAIGISSVRPRVLCFSNLQRNPEFVFAIQKCGVQYARVDSPAMLIEAVELLLCELRALEQHGPVFRVTHKYAQGICGPGEEVSAIEILVNGNYRHLPLAITERLIFEALAQH